jgi:hypothetical protein
MTMGVLAEWLRDRFWPTLLAHPKAGKATDFEWPTALTASDENLLLAYEALKDQMKSEDERMKIVEAKLLNTASFAPLAMTIFVAMITFLTSDKVQLFTRVSIWVVAIFGGYIALQFLLAVRAAIKGLARRSFKRLSVEDVLPHGKESRSDYLQRSCKTIAAAIIENRRVIDQKVGQLALCHESILNAVWGLLILLLVLLGIVATQPRPG